MTNTVDTFTLHVPGRPAGKGRPRFGGGHAYTDRPTELAEQTIRSAWTTAGEPRLPDGPVQIRIELGVTRPRGHYKTDGTLSAEGRRNPYPHRQKPDFDNAAKLVADALNTRAWRDDVQIIDARIIRVWADQPYTGVQASAVQGRATMLGAAALRTAA